MNLILPAIWAWLFALLVYATVQRAGVALALAETAGGM